MLLDHYVQLWRHLQNRHIDYYTLCSFTLEQTENVAASSKPFLENGSPQSNATSVHRDLVLASTLGCYRCWIPLTAPCTLLLLSENVLEKIVSSSFQVHRSEQTTNWTPVFPLDWTPSLHNGLPTTPLIHHISLHSKNPASMSNLVGPWSIKKCPRSNGL